MTANHPGEIWNTMESKHVCNMIERKCLLVVHPSSNSLIILNQVQNQKNIQSKSEAKL